MSYILIIGAKSDIAKAVAKEYAKNGYNLYLAARNSQELSDFSQDIALRYDRKAVCLDFDLLDFASHQNFYDSLTDEPLGVICIAGYMSDQKQAEIDFYETQKMIDTNYTGCVSLLNIIASNFEKRQSGFIVGVSSVAGDRGRKANYIYGSSKAAFTAYLSGLRNRLFESSVHVLTVKPGFVNTKMTEGMDLPEKLTAQPEEVAKDIYNAQQKNKNILYTKWIWKWVMLIIQNIPEFQFKKMSI